MNKKKFATKNICNPEWGGLKRPPHSLCINYVLSDTCTCVECR